MDDVPSTDALQDEMQQLAERYARMVPALHTLSACVSSSECNAIILTSSAVISISSTGIRSSCFGHVVVGRLASPASCCLDMPAVRQSLMLT